MQKYSLRETRSGKQTLILNNEREIKLHSAYDPEKEAERSVADFDRGRSSIIVVSGLALGYHIKLIARKYPDIPLIALEHDREVIDLASKTCPEHLKNITIVNSRSDIAAYFEKINIAGFRGISHFIHRPSYQIYKDFYDQMIQEIKQQISSRVSDILTRFEFEEKWIENIFNNIHHINSSTPVNNLFNKFRGYPGIIVSAGPSLKKNIDLLDSIRDRALILSVDTAFKVLQKKKVEPHIVMTLDAQKHSIKHFLGNRESSAALLADVVSYPGIIRSYNGNTILSTTSKYFTGEDGKTIRETTPVMDWIEKFIPGMGDVQSGGSVATSAFDLLLNLGCDPIILVGQDLAYTGREIHCTGTHHNEAWLPLYSRTRNLDSINQGVIRKRSIKYVESFGGNERVISDFVLDLYRGWFEDSASRVNIQVINATEGGARIKNTTEESLETIISRIEKKKKTPEEVLKKHLTGNTGKRADHLINAIDSAIKSIKKVKSFSADSIKDKDFENKIFSLMAAENVAELITPFLRKTDLYIARHGITSERAAEIISRDIVTASGKLIPMLEKCLMNFNSSEKTFSNSEKYCKIR